MSEKSHKIEQLCTWWCANGHRYPKASTVLAIIDLPYPSAEAMMDVCHQIENPEMCSLSRLWTELQIGASDYLKGDRGERKSSGFRRIGEAA